MPQLLNPKHELFAQHLARGEPQARAYAIAGYAESDSNASTLANRPDVKMRREEIQRKLAASVKVTADRVLSELAKIGFANVADVIEIKRGKVKIKDTANLPDEVKSAIAEIRAGREGTVVKMYDKVAALEKLGKHLGLFKENINLDVNVSLADLVNGSYRLERGETIDAVAQEVSTAEATPALPVAPRDFKTEADSSQAIDNAEDGKS